jgi:hypothetical protein
MGDKRALDVLALGELFIDVLLALLGHSLFSIDHRKQRKDTAIRELPNLPEAAHEMHRRDFQDLILAIIASNEEDRPTAASVAKYLRLGYFEWGWTFKNTDGDSFGTIACNTCGHCCRQ